MVGEPSPWSIGFVDTPAGRVARIATRLSPRDRFGALKVRLSIGRMGYAVEPGLYAVGNPTPDSPVLVSANYKLSFDHLRRELGGLDLWIMVIDTKGINVWCAAGKGTFGTDEIVARIEAVRLSEVVAHRTLILPQLGAPGVAAHEVRKRSGFAVKYGPVRASDIPAYLGAGMKATAEMRRVHFDLAGRMAVIPVELVIWGRYALVAAAFLCLLSGGFMLGGTDPALARALALRSVLFVLGAYLTGGVGAPILLPWLPGRAFSVKGAVLGLVVVVVLVLTGWLPLGTLGGWFEAAAWFLLMPAISAFMAMNFTGASTYASPSGVRREMRFAVPAQITGVVLGLLLWVAAGLV